MAGELKLATLIQRSLVPTEFPSIPGFEFSTKFVASSLTGGDYYDIFELEDKMRFGFILANCSGHGMASVFLSVLLKLTTQIEARRGMNPDEVLKHMTGEIQKNLKAADQANVFYGVVDRRRYVLNFARAGKVLSYLYKYADDKIIRLETDDGPIGKDSSGQFKAEEISLDPRDKLILASEGIIKALNEDHEAFGEDRFFETILKDPRAGCHDLRNEIFFQVSKFVDHREYIQDLTVLVMEVKDKVIKLRKG
jgi:sigma-B regulation protein RsbU (phosphoserine phosphatase)